MIIAARQSLLRDGVGADAISDLPATIIAAMLPLLQDRGRCCRQPIKFCLPLEELRS